MREGRNLVPRPEENRAGGSGCVTELRGGEEFISDGGETVRGRGALLESELFRSGFEIPASDSAVD